LAGKFKISDHLLIPPWIDTKPPLFANALVHRKNGEYVSTRQIKTLIKQARTMISKLHVLFLLFVLHQIVFKLFIQLDILVLGIFQLKVDEVDSSVIRYLRDAGGFEKHCSYLFVFLEMVAKITTFVRDCHVRIRA